MDEAGKIAVPGAVGRDHGIGGGRAVDRKEGRLKPERQSNPGCMAAQFLEAVGLAALVSVGQGYAARARQERAEIDRVDGERGAVAGRDVPGAAAGKIDIRRDEREIVVDMRHRRCPSARFLPARLLLC